MNLPQPGKLPSEFEVHAQRALEAAGVAEATREEFIGRGFDTVAMWASLPWYKRLFVRPSIEDLLNAARAAGISS